MNVSGHEPHIIIEEWQDVQVVAADWRSAVLAVEDDQILFATVRSTVTAASD